MVPPNVEVCSQTSIMTVNLFWINIILQNKDSRKRKIGSYLHKDSIIIFTLSFCRFKIFSHFFKSNYRFMCFHQMLNCFYLAHLFIEGALFYSFFLHDETPVDHTFLNGSSSLVGYWTPLAASLNWPHKKK